MASGESGTHLKSDVPDVDSGRYTPAQVIGGKYRLVRVLGQGGMGTVWVARNEALDIDVALKLIRQEDAHPEANERLLREARAAARLGHSSIIRVFDFGATEEGDPFIVMELLSGETIAEALERRGRVSAVRGVQMMLPIADALAAAHEAGIVHRDLKPENIFLARGDGRIQPKILDFGIAKLENKGLSKTITQLGSVMGSPLYMSPEQARGEANLGRETDVWAFCVVLYEAVSGHVPFAGDNYNATMRAIVETEPPPLTDYIAGDAELAAILARGMSKARDDRWTMRELGRALARWLWNHGVGEDICGTALEAAWLSAPSLHDGYDGLAEPAPSMRRSLHDIRGSSGQHPPADLASTKPPGAETVSTSTVPSPSHAPRRTPWLWVGLGAAALVLAGFATVAIVTGKGEELAEPPAKPAAPPPATTAAAPKAAEPADEPTPAASASATPQPSASTPRIQAEPTAKMRPPPTRAPTKPRPAPKPKKKKKPEEEKPAGPGLKNPYE